MLGSRRRRARFVLGPSRKNRRRAGRATAPAEPSGGFADDKAAALATDGRSGVAGGAFSVRVRHPAAWLEPSPYQSQVRRRCGCNVAVPAAGSRSILLRAGSGPAVRCRRNPPAGRRRYGIKRTNRQWGRETSLRWFPGSQGCAATQPHRRRSGWKPNLLYVQSCRSRLRYWMASLMWSAPMSSTAARSAMVRATLRMRS
jgi:hypothetical protein